MSSLSLQLPQFFTTFQIPLIFLNNILALAIPPKYHVLRVGFSLPILILLIAQSLYKAEADPVTSTFGDEYAINCLILCAGFVWVDWIGISTPDREQWRKIVYHVVSGKEKKEVGNGYAKGGKANGVVNGMTTTTTTMTTLEPFPTTFLGRLWWAARLAPSMRYVGWTSQAKNTPIEVQASYSRIKFVIRKSLRALLCFCIKDVVNSYIASTPYGSWDDIAHLKVRRSFFEAPFWTRFFYIWVDVFVTYFSREMVNAAGGAVLVALGLANPRDCPSAYGDLKELVSVRKLWAIVWHQQVRRWAGDPGIYLARDILGLRKGSFASKYLQLFIAFGLSGAMHAGASMLIHRSLEGDAAMSFFVGQAFIILIEDHIIDFGKKFGFRDSMFWRISGFLWVFLIMGTTLQKWQGSVIDRGLWVHHRDMDILGIGPQLRP